MNLTGIRPLAWLGCAALALLAPALFAASFPSSAQVRTAFTAVNLRGNQAISVAEWEQASFALFRSADKNNDDAIDRDELQAGNLAPDTFLRADLNRDERLSVSEFADLRRAIFTTADIDRDEYLTPVEFELLIVMERVGWLDANQNGRIEMSELTASLAKAFAVLDQDQDGALSAAEAAYLRPTGFQRYDTSRDGKLSREEFVKGYRTELTAG